MPRAIVFLGVVLIAALAVSACGGQSKQEKAQSQVCDARADISKQVDELKGMTITTATVDGVKGNVAAIQDDLKKIAGARDRLSDDRRAQVKSATDTFVSSVTSIAQGLKGDVSIAEAGPRLKSAAQDLGAAYASTLGKIAC